MLEVISKLDSLIAFAHLGLLRVMTAPANDF
jgi:hypothetical protein